MLALQTTPTLPFECTFELALDFLCQGGAQFLALYIIFASNQIFLSLGLHTILGN
jgi:hypothetical protein